jgi:hypothetical protein
MATYNIYLVRLGDIALNDDQQTQVRTLLKGFFDRVIRSSRSLRTRFDEGVRVRWTTSCPTTRIQGHELLIYMVQSVISSAWATGAGGKTGSEVYVGRMTPALVARVAFHEAMHNKTHWNDRRLHGRGGLARATVLDNTRLTRQNIQDMARVLGRNRPQWTGGCALMNDPLRGL